MSTCETVKVQGSQAWCGILQRPWDPANPTLGSFPLAFSIVLPGSGVTTQPAVVGLEGGPGYGSISSGQRYAGMLGPLMADRALLVVDARGTGRSGQLHCPSIDSDMPWGRASAECAALLGERANLMASALVSDDLAALVGALGLGKVDVYGDSYGTFLAQVVAGHHPEIVRSLVLDAAYPVVGETAWYPTMGHAMRTTFNTVCQQSPYCSRRSGTTMTRMAAVLDVLRRGAVHVRAPAADARMHEVTIDPPTLVAVAFNATYVRVTDREMDAALRAGLVGDWLPLGRLVAEYENDGSHYVGRGTGANSDSQVEYTAVSCHDYPQLFNPASDVAARSAQINAAVHAMERENPGVYGPFTVAEFRKSDWSSLDLCTNWPGPSADPARLPGPIGGVYPDVPTLVMTGEFDTITTPAEGDIVARQFPRSRHVIITNALHVSAGDYTAGCAETLVRDFLVDSAEVLARPRIDCSHSYIRAAAGYPRTARGLSLPFAAGQTIADVIDVALLTSGWDGIGLRGGNWHLEGWPLANFTLRGVKLYDGLPVSGRVRWDATSGDVVATVRLGGETWTGHWNTRQAKTVATMTRTAGGPRLTVRFPAP